DDVTGDRLGVVAEADAEAAIATMRADDERSRQAVAVGAQRTGVLVHRLQQGVVGMPGIGIAQAGIDANAGGSGLGLGGCAVGMQVAQHAVAHAALAAVAPRTLDGTDALRR